MEKLIAIVPTETYQEPSITGQVKWTSKYNLALWLRVPEVLNNRVRLVLKYRDAKGIHSVLVDKAKVARNVVLLSNLVKVTAHGAINYMGVFLYFGSISFEYTVDELFAQRKLTIKHTPVKPLYNHNK